MAACSHRPCKAQVQRVVLFPYPPNPRPHTLQRYRLFGKSEEKSEAELALGTAVDDFVCTHCPESYAWRFVDAARTDIYIDGVDAYAGLPMTIHWNPDGTVHDITGYDPAWQRIVSVCGRDMQKSH